MIISGSVWRKALATAVAAFAFVSLYEVTALDSRYAARDASVREGLIAPKAGSRLSFSATAYCKGMVTAAGVAVRSGIAAADPELLPVGSIVDVDGLPPQFNGIYSILDTGPSVQGRHLDLYMWSCDQALEFGRKPARLTVLRLGWNPRDTTVGLLDRLFRRPGSTPQAARPVPQTVLGQATAPR